MGLNREIRNLNETIQTEKQLKKQERQEKQELKNLQLLENAQIQTLTNYIKSTLNDFLLKNYYKYKNDLYLFQTKEKIKQKYLISHKEHFDIVYLFFDKIYYKQLKEQIKIHEQNQNAILQNRQQLTETTKKQGLSIFKIIFLFFFHFFNILNLCLCGFSKNKRRL